MTGQSRDSGKEVLRQIIEGLEGVTDGPWFVYGEFNAFWIEGGQDGYRLCEGGSFSGDERTGEDFKNAEHIARCHPDAMRAIAAYVDELRAALEPFRNRCVPFMFGNDEDVTLTFKASELRRARAACKGDSNG